jgi:hypothetical protein
VPPPGHRLTASPFVAVPRALLALVEVLYEF